MGHGDLHAQFPDIYDENDVPYPIMENDVDEREAGILRRELEGMRADNDRLREVCAGYEQQVRSLHDLIDSKRTLIGELRQEIHDLMMQLANARRIIACGHNPAWDKIQAFCAAQRKGVQEGDV